LHDDQKHYLIQRPVLAVAAGFAVGSLGGLIGLGGAEFRLPILISAFALLPQRAIRFNLLISLVTLAAAAATRSRLDFTPAITLADVAASIIAGGMIAAWLGAAALARLSHERLMSIIILLLSLISALLTYEAIDIGGVTLPHVQEPVARVIAGLGFGVLVGLVSSLLGVAGGEFIILILAFVFGADKKTVGTLSLLISLPIVATGVVKHWLTGHYRSRDVLFRLVLPMSLGSIAGAILGGALAATAPVSAIKLLLAAILAASAIKLARESRIRPGRQ